MLKKIIALILITLTTLLFAAGYHVYDLPVTYGAKQKPDDSSVFDTVSTTKGARSCPTMTEAQRDAIASPVEGLCVYNTTSQLTNWYNGSAWQQMALSPVDHVALSNVQGASEQYHVSSASYLDLEAIVGDIMGTGNTQTVTAKSIDADNNTITNIDNDEIKAAAGIVESKLTLDYSTASLKATSDTIITNTTSYKNEIDTIVTNTNTYKATMDSHIAATAAHGVGSAIAGITDLQELKGKTFNLTYNYVSGTTAEFNTALSGGDFATLAGTESLTNKTLVYADVDGGTASNTHRITVPKADKAGVLDGLTRKQGTILYDSTGDRLYIDNGAALSAVSTGSPTLNIGSTTTNYTILNEDLVFANAASGTITVTLPNPATANNKVITVVKTNATNTVVVDNFASELINGATTTTLTNTYSSVALASDGTNWYTSTPYVTPHVGSARTYSFKMSSTGVVSSEVGDVINGNCSQASNAYTCTFTSGAFSTSANCVNSSNVDNRCGYFTTITGVTSFVVSVKDCSGNGAQTDGNFSFVCHGY